MRNVTDEYVVPINAYGPGSRLRKALNAFGQPRPRPDLPCEELLDRIDHLFVVVFVLARISMVRTQSLY